MCRTSHAVDYTIVHVGFALTNLDEQSALETLELFKSVGLLDEERRQQAEIRLMKYLDEFADPLCGRLLDEIAAASTSPWAIMEVCGGQTHTIIRNGVDQLLPP